MLTFLDLFDIVLETVVSPSKGVIFQVKLSQHMEYYLFVDELIDSPSRSRQKDL